MSQVCLSHDLHVYIYKSFYLRAACIESLGEVNLVERLLKVKASTCCASIIKLTLTYTHIHTRTRTHTRTQTGQDCLAVDLLRVLESLLSRKWCLPSRCQA